MEEQIEPVEADLEPESDPATNLAPYPNRSYSYAVHSIARTTRKPYDQRLYFTEASVPINRNDLLRPRALFDHAMPPMHMIHIDYDESGIQKVLLGDTLDTLDNFKMDRIQRCVSEVEFWKFYHIKLNKLEKLIPIDAFDALGAPSNNAYSSNCFSYDIRHGYIVNSHKSIPEDQEIKNSNEFVNLIAQVKFLNGWIEGYSDAELAALTAWLWSVPNIKAMEKHFEGEILAHKPHRNLYKYSQIKGIFDAILSS